MKNAFRFITVSLAIVALAACNQQTSAPVGTTNDNLVLGMGEIPMGTGEGIDTQALDAVFNSVDPSDGAGIDFTVDSPSDIVFDDQSNVNYIRTRVRVTNNTGGDITNLTLMAIAPRAGTVTALSRLRDLVGNPLSQEEAFNANTVTDPTAVDPNFIPSPTHAVEINEQGNVRILQNRADFVAYSEDELTPIITELNNLAANDTGFGLTGQNGTDFSLLPYGFQVGSLDNGEQGFVDVVFSIPNDPGGAGVSPLARFGYTFIATQDTVGRVTEAPEEIETGETSVDVGVGDSINRLLNFTAPSINSNIDNMENLVLIGNTTRDVDINTDNIICLEDVRIGFNVASAQILTTTQNPDAQGTAGECTLVDATGFNLAVTSVTQTTGIPDDDFRAGSTIGPIQVTLSNAGTGVEGRIITAELTAPADASFATATLQGVTDANGRVTFNDFVINDIGTYTVTFTSGSQTTNYQFDIIQAPFDSYELVFVKNVTATEYELVAPENVQLDPDQLSTNPLSWQDTSTDPDEEVFLAIRAVDAFGNDFDFPSGAGVDSSVFIDAELLQGGTAFGDQDTLIGYEDDGGTIQESPSPYPTGNSAIEVDFAGRGGNSVVVFDGSVNTVIGADGDATAANAQVIGTEFRIGQGGTYTIQISVSDTDDGVIELASNPVGVLTTPEISITAAVAELVLIEPDLNGGNKVGEPLVDAAGNPIRVRVLDESGNPLGSREVTAQIIAGNTAPALLADFGVNFDGAAAAERIIFDANDTRELTAIDLNAGPYATNQINGICFFNFGMGTTERGAGANNFAIAAPVDADDGICGFDPTVAVAANDYHRNVPYAARADTTAAGGAGDAAGYVGTGVTGVRTVTAQTNPQGIATFNGDSALIIGAPGNDYRIQFSADNGLVLATATGAVAVNHTGAGSPFTVAAAGDPFNSVTSAQFDVAPGDVAEVRLLENAGAIANPGAANGSANADDAAATPDWDDAATGGNVAYLEEDGGPFSIGLYDVFGNRVSNGTSQVLVSKAPTGGNNLYGEAAAAATAAALPSETGRTFATDGAGPDGHQILFDAATNNLASLIFANSTANVLGTPTNNITNETGVRISFQELATGTTLQTPGFTVEP